MLKRRTLIQGFSLLGGLQGLAPRLAGGLACSDGRAGRLCQAGVPSQNMNMVYACQKQSQWCWAACIEMVFRYWGHKVSQQEIVRRTWGSVVNMPAQPYQIVQALNRPWVDDNGVRFTVAGDTFTANAMTAAQDLASDMPLIVGSLGHAMVVTAITYQGIPGMQQSVRVVGATVRDPWPGRGKRELTIQEYLSTLLLVRIRIA